MNHKRGRPKNRRAGCLMCKFWKVNGYTKHSKEGEKFSDYRRWSSAGDDLTKEIHDGKKEGETD